MLLPEHTPARSLDGQTKLMVCLKLMLGFHGRNIWRVATFECTSRQEAPAAAQLCTHPQKHSRTTQHFPLMQACVQCQIVYKPGHSQCIRWPPSSGWNQTTTKAPLHVPSQQVPAHTPYAVHLQLPTTAGPPQHRHGCGEDSTVHLPSKGYLYMHTAVCNNPQHQQRHQQISREKYTVAMLCHALHTMQHFAPKRWKPEA